jgi:hypothetical protein
MTDVCGDGSGHSALSDIGAAADAAKAAAVSDAPQPWPAKGVSHPTCAKRLSAHGSLARLAMKNGEPFW